MLSAISVSSFSPEVTSSGKPSLIPPSRHRMGVIIDSQSSLLVFAIRNIHHAIVSKIHKGLEYLWYDHSMLNI